MNRPRSGAVFPIAASLKARLAYLAGVDILSDKYAFGRDDSFGWMAKEKIPDRWTRTTCGYCSVGCGIEIGVRDGRAVSVRGDLRHPVNQGKLCPKGLSEHHPLSASNRALYPLLRSGGKLGRVGWDEALESLAEAFRKTIDRHGPEAAAVVGTGQLVSEEFYALGKLARLGLGAAHSDGNTTLCMASAVMGYKRSLGSDGPPGCYDDLERADVVFLVGSNIADNHPILCYRLAKNRGAFTIVADPRVTKTAMMSDLHLPLRSRSDAALINGLLHLLIRDGKTDREFIEAHTTGFEALEKSVEDFTPDRVAAETGLNVGDVLQAAWRIGRAEALFVGWTMGVNHSDQGAETVSALCNLSLALGQIGKPGAAPFSITGQCNAMGTRECGFTSSMPGYRSYDDPADRAELAALWGVEPSDLPVRRGLAYPDIVEGTLSGKIKCLWIIGTNPLVSFPNQAVLRQALENLDFLAVQDGFHPTPTTELAHLVLPAAIWGEKEGVFVNSERRVSKVNRAVDPPGEAKSDFDIFLGLARKLGVEEKLFKGWTKPERAFNEWRRVSRGRLCDYSGISYELLETAGPIQWPQPEGPSLEGGDARLYQDGRFQTPDGKARFHAVEPRGMPEKPRADFPLLLNTGRTVEHWHTRTRTGKTPILERLSPEAWVEVNPSDARALRIRQGDYVRLVSPRGSIERIAARITEIVPPGHVFVPFHYEEANVNELTLNVVCPISREPNFKQCAVRLEPVAEFLRVGGRP